MVVDEIEYWDRLGSRSGWFGRLTGRIHPEMSGLYPPARGPVLEGTSLGNSARSIPQTDIQQVLTAGFTQQLGTVTFRSLVHPYPIQEVTIFYKRETNHLTRN